MASRSPWWTSIAVRGRRWTASGSAVLVCISCGAPRVPPYSRDETATALAPARDLWPRCYAGSELARAGREATLEYRLNVAADGTVQSIPTLAEPENPRLVECVRLRLNELRFPARGKDHVALRFELGPKGLGKGVPLAPQPQRDVQAGNCEPACAEG